MESVEATSNLWVRAAMKDNVQKQMTSTTKNASEAAQVKVTVGTGVGAKVQVPGVKIEGVVNGPQASVTTSLGGKTNGEGSVAGVGGELKVGLVTLKGGTKVGNIEVKDGQTKVDPIRSGAGLDIASSKELKQGQTSAATEGSLYDATIAAGAQLGTIGIEVSANVIKGGKTVVCFFGTIVEYVNAVANDATQDFGGGKKDTPQR